MCVFVHVCIQRYIIYMSCCVVVLCVRVCVCLFLCACICMHVPVIDAYVCVHVICCR